MSQSLFILKEMLPRKTWCILLSKGDFLCIECLLWQIVNRLNCRFEIFTASFKYESVNPVITGSVFWSSEGCESSITPEVVISCLRGISNRFQLIAGKDSARQCLKHLHVLHVLLLTLRLCLVTSNCARLVSFGLTFYKADRFGRSWKQNWGMTLFGDAKNSLSQPPSSLLQNRILKLGRGLPFHQQCAICFPPRKNAYIWPCCKPSENLSLHICSVEPCEHGYIIHHG